MVFICKSAFPIVIWPLIVIKCRYLLYIFFKQAKPQNLLLWIIFKSPNVEMAISYTTMELAAACMKRFLEIVIKNWHETQFFLHIYMYQINLNLQKTAIPLKYWVFETLGPTWVPSGHLKGCLMAGNII